MNEAELILFDQSENCTLYTIRFLTDEDSEVEKFYAKFKDSSIYNADFEKIISVLMGMMDHGALINFLKKALKMARLL